MGDNFDEIVYDETKEVFVLFYTSSASNSKRILKVWEKAAKEMQDIKKLLFVEIDM